MSAAEIQAQIKRLRPQAETGEQWAEICRLEALLQPKLSDELLDDIDGAEETQGRDSRLTRWAEMAQGLEDRQLPRGLSLTCGDDGAWLHFDNGTGQKASFNVANMVRESGYITRMAVLGWVERYAAQVKS